MSFLSQTGAMPSVRRKNPIGIRARFMDMLALRRQRAALATLDAHLLNDIGVCPIDANAESQKPVWDVPLHWHQ